MKRRVVVTGLGAVTPIGNTVEEFWSGIKAGKVGIGEITKFDTTEYKVKIAAEVKDFQAKDRMDFKAARRMEPFSQYAVAAAKEAFEDAGLDMSKEDPFRVGVIVGSGIGSLQAVEKEYEKIRTKGPGRVNPLLVPMMISNMAAGNISIQLGLKGKCTNVVTACASGTNCIGDAFRAIQYGDAEVMLAGGAEGCICETGVAGFTSLTALSTSTDPMKASRPFDKDRDGFVLGEGAGVVVLEELEHALRRNAKIYAEITGFESSSDAYGIIAMQPDGAIIERMLRKLIGDKKIDYYNAHGTSTILNDEVEAKVLRNIFGHKEQQPAINSSKAFLGHNLASSGAFELAICVDSIQHNKVHGNLGGTILEDLNYTLETRELPVNTAVSASFGFGGYNSAILLERYKG